MVSMRYKPMIWVAYIATIWLANWMISNVGDCIPNGPCVIPVGFGLYAPSGVLMIGAALVLRDAIHETYGRRWVMVGIVVGAGLSAAISPALALASGVAFAVSEMGDFAIYEPLRRYSRPLGIAVSGTIGGAIDSALFLTLAFGSLDFFTGQFVGKTEMAFLGAAVLIGSRMVRRDLSLR